jgi:hypothetical protein
MVLMAERRRSEKRMAKPANRREEKRGAREGSPSEQSAPREVINPKASHGPSGPEDAQGSLAHGSSLALGEQTILSDIRSAKYAVPAEKRALLCKQMSDLRALLFAHNLQQWLTLIRKITTRTIRGRGRSVTTVMAVIASEAEQGHWQDADNLVGDLIDAVFVFTGEGLRCWDAYRKRFEMQFPEVVRYRTPITIGLRDYNSLTVRFQLDGEELYRLELDRHSDDEACLVFTKEGDHGDVDTRLEWSTGKADTLRRFNDKCICIELPRRGECRVGFRGREEELCCFKYDATSERRATLYVLSRKGKLLRAYSDWPEEE